MAIREFYIGTSGPFLYEDTDVIDNPTSGLDGETYQGFLCEGQLKVLTAPVIAEETVRLTDLTGRIYASTEVANIDDPSTELNAISSVVGTVLFVYETVGGGPDQWTQYVYDDDIGAENVPYTVDSSIAGEGWVAIAGKYSNINTVFDSVIANTGYYWGDPSTNGSWREITDGDNLVKQRREGGVWVTKETIYA